MPAAADRRRAKDGPARLILRTVLGGTMIAHGVRHGRTLEGTARWFAAIGFRRPQLQAAVSSALEVGAGAALVAGVATPLSASAVVGTMAVAGHTVHRPNGFFVVNEGWEYVAVVGAASIALSSLGAGRYSLDRALGLDRLGTPVRRALLTGGLGIAGAAAHLRLFWTPPAAARPE